MAIGKKLLQVCITIGFLASANIAIADQPITDPKLAVAKQRIRCGATAMTIAKLTTDPGSKEIYTHLALSLGAQARSAGVTPEMSQGWANELRKEIDGPDETAIKKNMEAEIRVCELYGMFSVPPLSK